jgi:anti-sigma factor RsiW
MKWFCHPCRRRREICLLAAGALPEQDRPEMERHLAACAACQNYYNEIKALAAPLAGWEKNFAQIEPTQAMQARWAGAVQASAAEAASREFGLRGSAALPGCAQASAAGRGPLLKEVWGNVWRELIWPSRRVWVGLAAVWLALLAVNARLSDHPMQLAGAHSASAEAMMQSWEEQTRVLAELTQPAMVHSAPVHAPAAPANPPRPRSARKQDWQIV